MQRSMFGGMAAAAAALGMAMVSPMSGLFESDMPSRRSGRYSTYRKPQSQESKEYRLGRAAIKRQIRGITNRLRVERGEMQAYVKPDLIVTDADFGGDILPGINAAALAQISKDLAPSERPELPAGFRWIGASQIVCTDQAAWDKLMSDERIVTDNAYSGGRPMFSGITFYFDLESAEKPKRSHKKKVALVVDSNGEPV